MAAPLTSSDPRPGDHTIGYDPNPNPNYDRPDVLSEMREMAKSTDLESLQTTIQAAFPEKQQEKDPWQHRSAGMRCRTCMYAVWKEAIDARPAGSKRVGRCRRHAPTMSGYPAIFEDDFCGDHKIDENKV